MKVKKGDNVKMISGNDKGKQGKVLAVFPDASKILVEGIHMKKKHVRPRREGQKGELVRIPAPFPISRAMLLCPRCGKAGRIAQKRDYSGKKIRVCRKCEGEI